MNAFCELVLTRFSVCTIALTVFLALFPLCADAQKRRPSAVIRPTSQNQRANLTYTKYRSPISAVVVIEKLAVLRFEPDLAAIQIQRLQIGRNLLIIGERQTADDITFLRVSLSPDKSGWIQSEAVAAAARSGDAERVARIIRVAQDFEQLELASIFLENFPKSAFRPAILLLAGDLAQEAANKISRAAQRKLNSDEMQASGAPVYSFYRNFNELDRYRKLNINFIFDLSARQFNYDGATWREILQKYPASNEAVEARKRLASLTAPAK